MEEKAFVNEALSNTIELYLESKNVPEGIAYNSFLVVILRIIAVIYDELDFLNPYLLKNEQSLYTNLEKYGYTEENLKDFLEKFSSFYNKENRVDFINIQKALVDMLTKKRLSIDVVEDDIIRVRTLLYSSQSINPLQIAYNYFMTDDQDEVLKYFDEQLESNKRAKIIAKPKEVLSLEAYEILNYRANDIESMDAEKLDAVNKEVYSFFEINENAINKNYLLEKAIKEYNTPEPTYATGNGYVDILFFLSILATVGLVILVVTLLVF